VTGGIRSDAGLPARAIAPAGRGSVHRNAPGPPGVPVETILAVAGALSAAYVLVSAVNPARHLRQLDIDVYLMGARHLLDGRLYLTGLAQSPHLPFTYPPFAALVFTPLALLPTGPAQVLWSVVNVLALFALVRLSIRAVRPGIDGREVTLWSFVLMAPAYAMEPVSLTFSFGQVNLVLAALVLWDLTGDVRLGRSSGRPVPRGVLVGVAAAVKLTPLVFIPYLFVTGRARAAWTAVVSFSLCSAVAAVFDPRVSWAYWTRYATDARRIGAAYYISNQSLQAAADRLDHRVVPAGPVDAVALVVLVAGVALAAWAYRASSDLLGILVCAATGLLVSPVTWAHHMVWIVPVLVWLAWAPDRPRSGRAAAAAGAVLFWWAPIWTVPNGADRELSEHCVQLALGNAFFLATVLFLAGTTVLMVSRGRHDRFRAVVPRGTVPVFTDRDDP